MTPDLAIQLGVIVIALAIPATISAFSTSNRSFRGVVFLIVVGGGLIVWANLSKPGGYTLNDVTALFGDSLSSFTGP